MNTRIFTNVRWHVLVLAAVFSTPTVASPVIEMPDTTEVPDMEKSSMLLDIDIPSVRERDPDPMSGPRLNVKEFRVQGLVEYPDMGISRAELIERVEAIRFDLMEEGEHLESGYTLNELGELSDLLASIESETSIEHVGPIEVQRLVFLIREQRRERGITLGMIEMVADTITQYYRERGFVLAKAFIPQQHVRDGVVSLTLLLGDLGEVEVHNNKRYSDRLIQNMFRGLMDKPVTSSNIEEHLYFVNDLPGLSAQGFFEAGNQVGDSKLNVNVTSERWYDANVRVDNHGSTSSGEYRLYSDFYANNLVGIGDQLHFSLLNSFKPDNSLYGSVRYNSHIYSPRIRFSAGISNNDFALDNSVSESINQLDINGRSRLADASLKYQFKRSRATNYSAGVQFARIESRIRFGAFEEAGDIGLDDTVHNIETFYEFDVLNEEARRLHQGRLAVTSSRFLLGAEENQDENPWLLNADYSLLAFAEIPFTDIASRVVTRAAIQYSGTALSSINQFSLAGPTRTRGFVVNEFYADDGFHFGIDWIFKGPEFGGWSIAGEALRDIVQPFLLADISYGVAHPTLDGATETTAYLSNVGVGLKLNYRTDLRSNLQIAIPVLSNKSLVSGDVEPDNGAKVYFDLQYSF